MKKRLHIKQFGFEGKKGVAAVTMVQTPDGRLGFFHQVLDTGSKAKSIRNGQSKPIYIDGELSPAEVNTVKNQFCENLVPNLVPKAPPIKLLRNNYPPQRLNH